MTTSGFGGLSTLIESFGEEGDPERDEQARRIVAKLDLLLDDEATTARPEGVGDPLDELEERVDQLLDRLGCAVPPRSDLPPDVEKAARAGREIEAIYLYRKATGASLRSAMRAVRQLTRSLDKKEGAS